MFLNQKLCESLLESQMAGAEILEPEAVWEFAREPDGRGRNSWTRSCESLLESQMTGAEILEPEAVWDGESGESGRHHHEHLRTQWRLAHRRLRSSLAVSTSAKKFSLGLFDWFSILRWLNRELQY